MKSQLNRTLHDTDPTIIVELFQVDLQGKGTYYFHGGENGFQAKLVFDGRGYDFIPLKAEGFEFKGDGRLPRPTMTISNHMGFMSIKALYFDDFISHKVTRIKTFVKFLDDENFPNNVNPFGPPDVDEAFAKDEYYINQKIREDKNSVEFELVSILELQDIRLPARRVMSDYCSWIYRSTNGCGYAGEPCANIYNKKIKDGGYDGNLIGAESFLGATDFIRDADGNVDILRWNVTGYYDKGQVVEVAPPGYNAATKPSSLYVCLNDNIRSSPDSDSDNWARDECSKDLQGCRLRYGTGAPGDQETTKGLPFGAFPGVAKYFFE